MINIQVTLWKSAMMAMMAMMAIMKLSVPTSTCLEAQYKSGSSQSCSLLQLQAPSENHDDLNRGD